MKPGWSKFTFAQALVLCKFCEPAYLFIILRQYRLSSLFFYASLLRDVTPNATLDVSISTRPSSVQCGNIDPE